MAAPTSDTDICNLAMDHIGQVPDVTNIITPESESELKCARWYDATRRTLLRAFPFTFARSRFQASRAGTPTFGYADAYNLPNDFIRLTFIGDDSIRDYKKDYAIEGRQLLLNNSGAASVNIGYIKDVTDVTKFDSLFVDLFAVELAFKMSYAFTVKRTLRADLMEYRDILKIEAKAVNSQERPPVRIESSKFANARNQMLSNVAGTNTVFRT